MRQNTQLKYFITFLFKFARYYFAENPQLVISGCDTHSLLAVYTYRTSCLSVFIYTLLA
jgi:hypothetical protein